MENPHGQRSLAGYGSWGGRESDTTKHRTVAFPSKGLPRWCRRMQEMWVQYLGLEGPLEKEMEIHSSSLGLQNSMDREAWWAPVHGVAKSWTRLSNWAHTHLQAKCWQWSLVSSQCLGWHTRRKMWIKERIVRQKITKAWWFEKFSDYSYCKRC